MKTFVAIATILVGSFFTAMYFAPVNAEDAPEPTEEVPTVLMPTHEHTCGGFVTDHQHAPTNPEHAQYHGEPITAEEFDSVEDFINHEMDELSESNPNITGQVYQTIRRGKVNQYAGKSLEELVPSTEYEDCMDHSWPQWRGH